MLNSECGMLNVRRLASLALAAFVSLALFTEAFAAETDYVPYTTYTYSYAGDAMESPDAYVPLKRYYQTDLRADIKGARGMASGTDGKLYIADTANSRLLVYDRNMKLLRDLRQFVDPALEVEELIGKENDPSIQRLNQPEGVFIDEDGNVYVADTASKRILEFDANLELIRQIPAPVSPVLPADFLFLPSGIVVDSAGRMFVLVKNCLMGIVELDSAGEFIGFFGAQKVRKGAFDIIRELFLTEEQKERTIKTVPRQYNFIGIDEENFIWLTTDSINWSDVNGATMRRARESDFAPIKRFNMNGDDVLVRGGFFPPTGDVVGNNRSPSAFTGVALKENGLYTVIDKQRNKIFTYDSYGNLLYAFGGSGSQLGLFTQVAAVVYRDGEMLILDSETGSITAFERTLYGEMLENALMAEKEREFDRAFECWKEVMRQNNNFDMAYTGIARVMLRQGDFKAAMEYYKYSDNTTGYSKAFKEYRKEIARKYVLFIPLAVVVIILLVLQWNKYTKKINETSKLNMRKYGVWQEVVFGFRVLFHPFDGFWDLKHEKRGSLVGAHIITAVVTLSFVYKAIGTAYLFNPNYLYGISLLQEIMNVILPLLLWCSASWALTTLMNGQARFRDVYLLTAYALLPLALVNFPVTLASNLLILDEAQFMNFFLNVGAVWTVGLIFVGTMVLQEYTLVKNALTTVISIVFMGAELFAGMLFMLLGGNFWRLVTSVYEEIAYRM